MREPMTEAKARERLARCQQEAITRWRSVDAILATTDALAVLLAPKIAEMLAAWERMGKVAPGLIGAWWRIVPDEEGARDG